LRLKKLNLEQVSFKKRNLKKRKKLNLKFGNIGFFNNKQYQFEFIYFQIIKRFLKFFYKFKYNNNNYFQIWLNLKPNFPISKKSKNSRMGKGKGSFLRWLVKLPINFVILEFNNINEIRLRKLLYKWNKHLTPKLFLLK